MQRAEYQPKYLKYCLLVVLVWAELRKPISWRLEQRPALCFSVSALGFAFAQTAAHHSELRSQSWGYHLHTAPSCVVPSSDPQRHFREVILNPPVNKKDKEVTFSPFNRKYKAFFLQSHRMYQGQSQGFHSLQKHCTPASRSHRGRSYTAAGPRGIFLDLIQVTLL